MSLTVWNRTTGLNGCPRRQYRSRKSPQLILLVLPLLIKLSMADTKHQDLTETIVGSVILV